MEVALYRVFIIVYVSITLILLQPAWKMNTYILKVSLTYLKSIEHIFTVFGLGSVN